MPHPSGELKTRLPLRAGRRRREENRRGKRRRCECRSFHLRSSCFRRPELLLPHAILGAGISRRVARGHVFANRNSNRFAPTETRFHRFSSTQLIAPGCVFAWACPETAARTPAARRASRVTPAHLPPPAT